MQEACRDAISLVAPGGFLILFLSDKAAEGALSEFNQLRWDTPMLLPASTQRRLLIGQKPS
jgi:hypothetical protein